MVVVPIFVESLESVGRKTDGCGGCEVEVTGVEEIEEGILEDFSPDC